jgi:hypothetical protein
MALFPPELITEIEREARLICEEGAGFGYVRLVIQNGEVVRIIRESERNLPKNARVRVGPPLRGGTA